MATYPLAAPPAPKPGETFGVVRTSDLVPVAGQALYKVKMSATQDLKNPTYERRMIGYSDGTPPVVTGNRVFITDPKLKFIAVRIIDADDEFLSNYSDTVAIDAGTVTPPVTPSTRAPSDVLDLTRFKLTAPSGKEYAQPALKGLILPDRFYVSDRDPGEVIFTSPCAGGSTTPKSSYQRSELRAMADGTGKKLESFDNATGVHTLIVEERFLHLPTAKPHAVGAQCHDADTKVWMHRLELRKIFIESPWAKDLVFATDYVLGQWIRLTAEMSKVGTKFRWENLDTGVVKTGTNPRVDSELYMKAGCYVQSNESTGDGADQYASVGIRRLEVIHS